MKDEFPRKMPDQFLNGSNYNMTMGALLDSFGDGDLFGFVLPSFQRPPVWSQEQQIRFMESVWLRLPIGIYVINVKMGTEFDYILLDGQQRLRAVQAYLADEFPVFGFRFSEITEIDKRLFMHIPFPRTETKETDWGKLKEVYNRMNFGGTAHEPGQVAL